MKRVAAAIFFLFLTLGAWAQTWSFGMSPFRSPLLTAQYWNPILDYVDKKISIKLELVTARTGQEASDEGARGKFDFIWDNHIFEPTHAAAANKVLARPAGEAIHGQIIVAENSSLKTLRDLPGQEMGVSSKAAFVGYAFLTAQGCNLYQGYRKSRPVPAHEFMKLMEAVSATHVHTGASGTA